MVDLAESSRPVDMITLIEELERHKDLQPVGDVGYVSGLLDGVPDRPSIAHYIKIVREKALLRGLIHTATSAIARAAEQSQPAERFWTKQSRPSSSYRNSELAAGSSAWRKSSTLRSGPLMRFFSAGKRSAAWKRTTAIWMT